MENSRYLGVSEDRVYKKIIRSRVRNILRIRIFGEQSIKILNHYAVHLKLINIVNH